MSSTKKNIKLCVLLGNRATFTRQKILFDTMERDPSIELHLILTGSLLTPPFAKVVSHIQERYKNVSYIDIEYDSTFISMAKSANRINKVCIDELVRIRPYAAIAIADRWEILPFAQAALYLNIKLIHIQGGEYSGNIDDKVRHAISAMSDIHFPTTEHAAWKLHIYGYNNVFNFGCPSIDMIKTYGIRRKAYNNSGYFICIFHPHTKEIENMKEQYANVISSIRAYVKETGKDCYLFMSNDDPGKYYFPDIFSSDNIIPVTNLTGVKYLKLLADAEFIMGNSSSGIREASVLAVPAINIGARQENRQTAKNIVNCKCEVSDISKAFNAVKRLFPNPSDMFGNGNASIQIINKIKEVFNER